VHLLIASPVSLAFSPRLVEVEEPGAFTLGLELAVQAFNERPACRAD